MPESAPSGDEAPFSTEMVAQLRAETPSTAQVIHLDNAGASPSPDPVFRRTLAHLQREREIGGYAAERETEAELADFYDSAAALIGAQPDEIAFAESATRAWDMAFYAISFRPGDRILTGRSEYASNYLAFMQAATRAGVEVEIIPDGDDGAINISALEARLDDHVKLVSICHAPTSNGLYNDAAAVGHVLKDHRTLYILDACQSLGQSDIDVTAIGCDIMTATGRKFLRGPRGTGLLYVRRAVLEALEPPFVDIRAANWVSRDSYRLRTDARRFETWESSIAGRLGLKAAIDYARTLGLASIERRVGRLAESLREKLTSVTGVVLRDRGTHRSGIVTMSIRGVGLRELRQTLARSGAMVSAIALNDARLDLEPDGCPEILRASVHYFNTEEEITRFVEMLDAALRGCRS